MIFSFIILLADYFLLLFSNLAENLIVSQFGSLVFKIARKGAMTQRFLANFAPLRENNSN